MPRKAGKKNIKALMRGRAHSTHVVVILITSWQPWKVKIKHE